LAEQSLLLAAALDALPNDYRKGLLMRHFDNLSYAEIAKSLDRTESATRMIWVRALTKLRQTYAGEP